jgi:hypothetical protein
MASGVAIAELEDALRQFFSPHTSNEAKRAIERGLEQLRADPAALQVGCEVLRVSREPLALFFAASALLEASVQTRWASTGNKAVLRQFLLSQVMERGDLGKAVSNKLAKVVVDIAAMDWPEQYPEFMESVLRAATLEAPQRAKTMGLQLLLLAVEEFAGSQSGTTSIGGHGKLRLPSRRRQELRRLLRKELADIVAAIESNLRSGLAAHQAQERAQQQQQQQQQPAFEALHLAFEALQQLMAALPLKECVSAETVGLLFRFVAVRRSPYAVQALTCVNEILDKNFFPKELGDYVINVAMSALATLEALVGNPAAALSEIKQCAQGFPSQYTRFLCVFLRQFLRKVENSPQFPLERFMALLETYTLAQPDPDEFLHALEAWHVCASRVADDAEQSSSPTQQQQQQQQQLLQQPAAERFMPALLRMMQRLVERLLWSKSRVFLAELDDEEPAEPREDESSKSAASSSGAGAALAGLGATRRPDSELEDCLDRVAHLVAELAVLPSPSAATGIMPLLQQIGRELEVCLAVLDKASASEQQQHNGEQNERVLDAASDARWLFDLAARVSPWLAGGSPRAFAEALPVVRRVCLEWPLAWAGRSSERRLFTRGARFARLHTAALQLAAGVCGMGWLHTCGLLSGAAIRDPQAPCAQWAAALNHPAATFLGVEDEERRREADRQRLCAEVAAAAAAAPDSLETLRDFDGSAAAVVDLALRTLPLPTLLAAQQQQQQQYLAPPPEEVMVAALGLLNMVGSRATPLCFFEYASVRRLCQDLAKHAAALPLEARCVLLVSVSDALLTSFSAGGSNGPQHGEPPSQARERQKRAYAALLGQEATRVLELAGRAVAAAAGGHPREASRGAEACRPHLRALGELSRGAVARTTVVKEVMAPVVLPALPPAVELIGALLTPRPALGAGPSSSQAGGRGALSLGPARDALDLIVAALQAFGRQAGAQACNETVSRLVEMFSAHATAQTLASAGGGGVMLLLKLLRLLAALIEEPTSAFKQLLPSILRLCFDDLPQVLAMLQQQGQGHLHGHGQSGSGAAAALPESAVDLLEVQYELLHKILRQHWGSYFFTRQLAVGSPGDGVALELAKAAANQRRHKLASEQSRHYFVRAMELLLDSFRRDGLSPDQFKKNLAIFDDLDRTHNLFMQEDFRRDMRPAFIQSLLGLLVANTHQLLEEELLVTVFGLASVDIENFYLEVLPRFVREFVRAAKGVDVSDSALQELLSVLPNVTDMPSFTMRFHEFANDLRYFAAVLPGPA